MTLNHPHALWLLLLAVPVIWLYRRRAPWPHCEVTTQWLWDEVLSTDVRTRWLPWRERASLVVSLVILALVTLSAADPRDAPRRWALVLDNAPASCDATKRRALAVVESLGEGDAAMIIAGGEPTLAMTGLSHDRDELARAIAAVEPSNGPVDHEPAVGVAYAACHAIPERVEILWVGPAGVEDVVAGYDAAATLPVGRATAWSAICLAMAIGLAAARWCLIERRWLN